MGRHGENIRRRKDGRWEARIICGYDSNGKAKYRSIYGKTYQETKKKRNAVLSEKEEVIDFEHGKEQNQQNVTVKQVMQEWLASRKGTVKASTLAQYASLVQKHLLPELGEYPVSALTSEIIDQFLKDKLSNGKLNKNGGLSPKTVADIRSVLLLGLEYARQRHYSCPVNDRIFYPKNRQPHIQVLSREEQTKLERVLFGNPEPLHFGILLTLYSGLRIGEVCALQWKDIQFEKGTLCVTKTIIRIRNLESEFPNKTRILIERPKTENSNRIIPVPTFILDFLKKYRQKQEAYLLTGTNAYLEPRICLNKYKNVLKKAGLGSFTFHTLRHTFATRCIESGFDPKTLSEILGHANVNTTLQRYVHPSLEMKREQMERLEKLSILGQSQGRELYETASK